MVFRRLRFLGAAIVAITFLISLVVLLMDGNLPVNIATVVATLLLGVVMKQSWWAAAPNHRASQRCADINIYVRGSVTKDRVVWIVTISARRLA